MTSRHRVPPAYGRAGLGGRRLLILQEATVLIEELGADLDRQLAAERRASERLRLLRETTNRITRAANDAIGAYRMAQRALMADLSGGDRSRDGVTRAELDAARLELLRVLELASQRYPWPSALGRPRVRPTPPLR